MTREDVMEEIKRRIPMELYLSESRNGLYCCPFCNSGNEGPGAVGSLKVYPYTYSFQCFFCDKQGTVIDLYRQVKGVDLDTAVDELAVEAGIEIDQPVEEEPPEEEEEAEPENTGYRSYYEECCARRADPIASAYLAARALTAETAERYHIGYDPESDPECAPGGQGEKEHPEARIIIPINQDSYIGVAIRGDIEKEYEKVNSAGSSSCVFNLEQLEQSDTPVFVTESVFDCLSLLEMGVPAIAIDSADGADQLVEYLSNHPVGVTLILAMDNDKTGQRATDILRQGLQQQNISFVCANVAGGYSDINGRLIADPRGLTDTVEKVQQQCESKPDNVSGYLEQAFMSEIDNFGDLKTGFDDLDNKSGGLNSGLYILAGAPSQGKTTFLNQICDQIASKGNDVLYFTLEQSRLEIISKSLARLIFSTVEDDAVTSTEIRKGFLPPQVLQAMEDYKNVIGDRISIVEGGINCNTSRIGEYIRQYIAKNSVKPVVMVDCLQDLLTAETDSREQSGGETIGAVATAMKRISRDLNIPVIAVTGVSQEDYFGPLDLESLDESGNLVYTADVIWGLQMNCVTRDPEFLSAKSLKKKKRIIREAKAVNPQKIDVVCLKNRYGNAGFRSSFLYYPVNDMFVQAGDYQD